jgi:hypothetical protein
MRGGLGTQTLLGGPPTPALIAVNQEVHLFEAGDEQIYVAMSETDTK